jgi:large subunit ribosomal protein L12e
LAPTRSKSYVRCTRGQFGDTTASAPKISPLGPYPKQVGDDTAKATGDWKSLRVTENLTNQNRQGQTEVVPCASALTIKALEEPPTNRKKQKTLNSVEITLLMRLLTLPIRHNTGL